MNGSNLIRFLLIFVISKWGNGLTTLHQCIHIIKQGIVCIGNAIGKDFERDDPLSQIKNINFPDTFPPILLPTLYPNIVTLLGTS